MKTEQAKTKNKRKNEASLISIHNAKQSGNRKQKKQIKIKKEKVTTKAGKDSLIFMQIKQAKFEQVKRRKAEKNIN